LQSAVTSRRDFLKTTLAASALATQSNLSAQAPSLFPGFEIRKVQTTGATINALRGGSGPPLLLLHGYPQTHVEWHRIAPRFASRFTVVMTDLRGYGDSSKPADGDNHSGYSKRAMARDQVELMHALGFDRFAVVGHDRGARVAWRMALEHPASVTRLGVIDIVPKPYSTVTREFAQGVLPDSATAASGDAHRQQRRVLVETISWRTGDHIRGICRIPPHVQRSSDNPCHVRGLPSGRDDRSAALGSGRREESRVSDVRAVGRSRHGRRRLYDVMKIWREHATSVAGKALPGGHFLPEELPDETLAALMPFLQG
jgi:haloacetate dehalogenase